MSKHKKVNVLFIILLLSLALLSQLVSIPIWIFALAAFIWFLIVAFGSGLIGSNYHIKAYCASDDKLTKTIAITFDDGPQPITDKVLDVLKKHQAKATFFCIGKNIEKHPEILQRLVEEGHIVGNHSLNHSNYFDFLRTAGVVAEIKSTDEIIKKHCGKKPKFFRPPYGVTNPSIRRALSMTGHKVIGWNIRSLDAVISNQEIVLKRIKNRISPGGIVLLHDTSENTVNVLEQLLMYLKRNDYRVVSLEELLKLDAYEI